MEIVSGRSMMDQIAFGRLRFFHRDIPEVTRFSQLPWQEEEARFRLAQRRAVLQLAAFHDQVSRQTEPNTASIFAIHAMLLEDDDFVNSILTLIRQEKVTAEYAVQAVGQNFRATFSAMDSSYMRARAADIRDISRRVMRLLMNCHPKDYLQQGPAILVSDEFFPSEVMDLNHRRLLGLVSRQGSVDSHTSMLLQAYHIPAMNQVDLSSRWDGHLALLDGFGNRLYLDPDRETVDHLRLRYQAGGRPSQAEQRELQPV